MEAKEWFALGSVLVALIALTVQQTRVWHEERKKDNRTANKLKLLYICQMKGLTEEEICNEYRRRYFKEKVDPVEISKTIYEMLAEETLVFVGDTKTYELRSHDSKESVKSSRASSEEERRRIQQMQQQQQ